MTAARQLCDGADSPLWELPSSSPRFDDHSHFTYVDSSDPPLRRRLIRLVERLSGRTRLVKRCRDFVESHPEPASFWADLPAAAGVDLQMDGTPLSEIPAKGSLVVVANHPFGVFDGIMLASLIARVRSDFLLLTNARLRPVSQVAGQWLPIDVEEGGESWKKRTAPMLRAVRHVRSGGCLVMFPSGGVATTPKLLARRAEEYPWAEGLSVMLRGGRTPVLPVFFHGQNGLLFNAASHISMTLRLGLLMREALHRLDKPMRITIGRLLQPSELPLGSEDLPARLRAHTLALGAVPLAA
ncbi:MAG: 1-acyl-sn-glycerol-3-phosphate acyltransferase [Geminicoccaceae bacterium]